MTEDQNQVFERNGTAPEPSADDQGLELEDNETHYPFDADKISLSPFVVPLTRLLDRLEEKTISVPPIQREQGIWSETQQSLLIESLMLRIPLPMFYVAADNDESWTVLDGLQRISTIERFCLGSSFPLSNLEFLRELNGKTFNELPARFRSRIKDTQLQFSVVNASTPAEVQRNIFKRLNTGGLALNQQEIRHALYFQENTDILLKSLVSSDSFLQATTGSISDRRMEAKEVVLRFIAFLVRGPESYPKNEDMDTFLCETMQILNLMPEFNAKDVAKALGSKGSALNVKYKNHSDIADKFLLSMERAYKIFGTYAFRKTTPTKSYRSPINRALFETISVILAEMDGVQFERVLKNRDDLFLLFDWLLYPDPFSDLPNVTKKFSAEDDSLTGVLDYLISRDSRKYSGVQKRFELIGKMFEAVSSL